MPRKKKKVPPVATRVREAALAVPFGVAAGVRRKNFNLPQWKIDRARDAFGAATETEAIERALDMAVDVVAFREATDRGLASMVGKGGFTNFFDPPEAS
jgi:hypothetical protein